MMLGWLLCLATLGMLVPAGSRRRRRLLAASAMLVLAVTMIACDEPSGVSAKAAPASVSSTQFLVKIEGTDCNGQPVQFKPPPPPPVSMGTVKITK